MRKFAEQGIRAVKMDDIASELGISKRTLYEIYKDKEELLFQGICAYDQMKKDRLRQYAESGHHVMDVVLEAYRMKVRETSIVSPAFYQDVLKYPRIERYVNEVREQTREGFKAFMRRGVEEGYFRADVDYELIPYLFDALEQHTTANKLLAKYTLKEIFVNLFLVSLRGLCTEAGIRFIEEAEI